MKALPLSFLSYSSVQQILRMPPCLMILAQLKQGQQVVQSLQPAVLLMPTSMIADSSACRHRHWSRSLPMLLLHRSQPIRQHPSSPFGVPLYPVDMIRLSSFTITAPTDVFMQFDRRLAMSAIFMKQLSQLGRKYRTISRSFRQISSRRSTAEPALRTRTRTNSRHFSYSWLCACSSRSMNSRMAASPSSLRQWARQFWQRFLKVASTSTTLMQLRFLSSLRMSASMCSDSTTALGVPMQSRKQVSRTCFFHPTPSGRLASVASNTAMPYCWESTWAMAWTPEQGSPSRYTRSTSSTPGNYEAMIQCVDGNSYYQSEALLIGGAQGRGLFSYQICIFITIMNDLDEGLVNYKTIIIGRSAVGKSTLLLRYVDGSYNPQKPTIGIDYRFKKVEHAGNTFNLELWDSAGQERYRTIVYNYFNLSKAAVVVFDLTNEDSLADAKTWLQQLVMHCGNDIPKLLLGNKSDLLPPAKLQEQLEAFKEQIDDLKREYKCEFFPVSALTGENVNEAFGHLIKELHDKNKVVEVGNAVPEKKKDRGMNLSEMRKEQRKSEVKGNSKCC